jgi:hypothetical protein
METQGAFLGFGALIQAGLAVLSYLLPKEEISSNVLDAAWTTFDFGSCGSMPDGSRTRSKR